MGPDEIRRKLRLSRGARVDAVPNAGDADLDGDFDSTDLIQLFIAGKFRTGLPATWSEGDFNGDGLFNETDLILAFATGAYDKGPVFASAVDKLFEIDDD